MVVVHVGCTTEIDDWLRVVVLLVRVALVLGRWLRVVAWVRLCLGRGWGVGCCWATTNPLLGGSPFVLEPSIDGLCLPSTCKEERQRRERVVTYIPRRSASAVRWSRGGCSFWSKSSLRAASWTGEWRWRGFLFWAAVGAGAGDSAQGSKEGAIF